MKTSFFRLLALLAVLTLGVTTVTVFAEDLPAVKARMNGRLPTLVALKAKGAVGENNRGFVEVRGDDASAASVVAAENADRETVYAALAKQTGASAEQVGRA